MNLGIVIVGAYLLLLCIVVYFTKKRFGNNKTIDEFIFAGRNVNAILLTPGVFNYWLWTTTIIGAAEAGIRYGISGGLAYAFGAGLAFVGMLVCMVYFRTRLTMSKFLTDFIGKRFSEKTRTMYYIFSVLIVIYIIIEMASGIGFVFNGLFDLSFKKIAVASVIIALIFVELTGIRGNLINDVVNIIIIMTAFAVLTYMIIGKFDIMMLYEGIKDVSKDPENVNYNANAMKILVSGGGRYFISAILVALAQTVLDPTYYLKSYIAKDTKTFVKAFSLGGFVMFIPAALLSTVLFGYTALVLHYNPEASQNFSVMISSKMLLENFTWPAHVFMGLLMLSVGITTIAGGLMGILGLASAEIYRKRINEDADDEKSILFGRVFICLIGIICGFIAISLENVSLLTVDTFCGIFFSAAAATVIMGLISKKKYGNLAIAATIIGAGAGFFIWLSTGNPELSWFYASLASFGLPFLFLGICGIFTRKQI